MANWNLPTITSGYLDFVTQMNDKFVDAATLLFGAPTNLPVNSIRYNRTTNIFEEWDLATWNPKVIGLLGGGTGSNTAAGARTNLGLGSMATQNSNAVNITGGSISGVNFDAGAINTGIVALARGGTGASLALGAAGSVFLSNGSQVVFDNGSSISNLNANALTTGTVPDARLSSNVVLGNRNNNYTGTNTYSNTTLFANQVTVYNAAFYLNAPNPQMFFFGSTGGVNQNKMMIMFYAGALYFQQQNDDSSYKLNAFAINADGSLIGIGSGLTTLNASALTTGIVPTARLGSGAANSGTFLRGDNVWAPATGGSGGTAIPSGLIAAFDVGCPAGWTRYTNLDNRFPLGSTSPGALGGSSQHSHHLVADTNAAGGHAHSFGGSVSGTTDTPDSTNSYYSPSGSSGAPTGFHKHNFSANFSGNTDGVGNHTHHIDEWTNVVDQFPPWCSVVYCRKD